jgi:hypothetical protein
VAWRRKWSLALKFLGTRDGTFSRCIRRQIAEAGDKPRYTVGGAIGFASPPMQERSPEGVFSAVGHRKRDSERSRSKELPTEKKNFGDVSDLSEGVLPDLFSTRIDRRKVYVYILYGGDVLLENTAFFDERRRLPQGTSAR